MNTFKSIGAVIAGALAGIVLSVGTDALLVALDIFPPLTGGVYVSWMLMLALMYRIIYTMLGGYVTARLAPGLPMFHVTILGIIGLVANLAGAIIGWDLGEHWYPIALVITAFPSTWLGGKLKMKSHTNQA